MTVKRNTIQKKLVLDAVRGSMCHATAEEIYQTVIREYPSISRTTVYRNLNQLAEAGEIKKVEVPGGPERFDPLCTQHYHVRCSECGQIFDVEMEYIPDLDRKITDSRGFMISGHDIIFHGICPECGKKH